MAVRLGVSLIAWQNDDLPELTRDYTTEGAMEDAGRIGFTGVERGRRMPADTEGLRAYLDRYGVALCGGGCSGNLMQASLDEEKSAIRAQVEQFAALDAPCIVYAECSNTVQGEIGTPVSQRPKLSRDEVTAYAAKLSELAKWSADQGVTLSYHHHMGAMVGGLALASCTACSGWTDPRKRRRRPTRSRRLPIRRSATAFER